MQGWVIDIQTSEDGSAMDVWLWNEAKGVKQITIPYSPAIHIHSDMERLGNLCAWLEQPEVMQRFSIGKITYVRGRLALDASEMHEVLEVELANSFNLRKVAEQIEARGDYHNYVLYSVDAHLSQRFLVQHGIAPFQKVEWDGVEFTMLEESDNWPMLNIIKMEFVYDSPTGFKTLDSELIAVEFWQVNGDGSAGDAGLLCRIERGRSASEFLEKIQQMVIDFDPEVILTSSGNGLHFPVLEKMASALNIDFSLSKNQRKLIPRSAAHIVQTYGRILQKDGYYPLYGRLHIDLDASFIVSEGGILGLFELARHSRQSPQDISRLSPGSVISAIQMKTAIEDGVLVPWKKNRPEDTKTAFELLHADRGGLYLDSLPGVYRDVIELDFASLFPSIIATRNISPETLNCACCQVVEHADECYVPLHPQEAEEEFRIRQRTTRISAALFPTATSDALQVPGLTTHTCGRSHGFLGRVVAPIIERRRQLKRLSKHKGDVFYQQQNALKWLLVTCFGYTGYKNARFGRIEAHEAICAWARSILLDTINMAEQEGWQVLHAIVDCVWIKDTKGRSPQQRVTDMQAFASKVSQQIGIPLEFEDDYSFIGFLPSRIHGAGSLTKYWAYGNQGLKLRGIEARQHSTCKWISKLQNQAFDILVDQVKNGGELDLDSQFKIATTLHQELARLERNEIPASELIVYRRVQKEIEQFTVETLTYSALLRMRALGYRTPLGSKVGFVITRNISRAPQDRVVLKQELESNSPPTFRIDYEQYSQLAIRAIWAILAPFGWQEQEIASRSKTITLDNFTHTKCQRNEDNIKMPSPVQQG